MAAQLGEESWSRPGGWGETAPSADTQTFRRAETPSPHFCIGKAFPKQLPDPTAAGLDALGGTGAGVGGAVGAAVGTVCMAGGVLHSAGCSLHHHAESSCLASWGWRPRALRSPWSFRGMLLELIPYRVLSWVLRTSL